MVGSNNNIQQGKCSKDANCKLNSAFKSKRVHGAGNGLWYFQQKV